MNVIDVADPTAPTSLGTSWFEGSAQAVRATDGVVRVVVTSGLGDRLPFVVPANGSLRGEARAEELNRELIEESVAEDWLPRRIDETADGTASTPITTIGCDQIGQPEEFSGLGLTWIATVDLRADAPETLGSAGVVSTGGTTYASADHLYVSTVRWDPPVDGVQPMRPEPPTGANDSLQHRRTGDPELRGIRCDRGQPAEPVLDVRARGATSASPPPTFDAGFGNSSESQRAGAPSGRHGARAVGAVGGLGKGERIYAVRFVGDIGYVVTFRQTDPLYSSTCPIRRPAVGRRAEDPGLLGLPAPERARDLLLGVGQDATDRAGSGHPGLAVRRARSGQPAPAITAALAVPQAVEFDHHAFLYWPETGQLVLPVDPYWCEGRIRLRARLRPKHRASKAVRSSSRRRVTRSPCRAVSPTRRAAAIPIRRISSGPWSSPVAS